MYFQDALDHCSVSGNCLSVYSKIVTRRGGFIYGLFGLQPRAPEDTRAPIKDDGQYCELKKNKKSKITRRNKEVVLCLVQIDIHIYIYIYQLYMCIYIIYLFETIVSLFIRDK